MIEKLLKIPDKERFEKDFELLVKKNEQIVKEGNKSQFPSYSMLSHRIE